MTGTRFLRPAVLQEPHGARIRCLTCERRCEIEPGGAGWCRTRRHKDGRLVTLVYGAVSSLSANPIEKKPLFHYHPGTTALTCGSFSCNFGCPWCQNYRISKVPPRPARFMSPAKFVRRAVDLGCHGTSISLNEPTLSFNRWIFKAIWVANKFVSQSTLYTKTAFINRIKPISDYRNNLSIF